MRNQLNAHKMMYVVSENENLLERLGLLILNSQVLKVDEQDDAEQPSEFVATLATARHYCEPTSELIVLVAKEWEPLILETIADLCRLLMAHSPDKKGKMVVIKKERNSDDNEVLDAQLLGVRQIWCQEWTFQFEKIRNLPNSQARTEALARLDPWTAPTLPEYSLLYFDDPDLPKQIADVLNLHDGLRIRDGFPTRPSLFTKPPALHWSHFPRDSELQIMFKFTFPQGTMPDPVFRDITRSAKDAYDFEYDYMWSSGIFLRQDLTKISVYRTNSHTIEIAGRIDVDEYAAEEDETQNDPPFKVVWPLLARVLKTIVRENLEYRTDGRLPYMLNIAFFGPTFFKDLNFVDVNGPVNARLLDAVQTFAAVERTGNVKFGIGKRLMAIDLKQAFPGFQPHSMADIFGLSDLPVSRNSTSSSRLSPVPPSQSHHPTTVIFENPDDMPEDYNFPPVTSPVMPNSPPGTGIGERSSSHGGLLSLAASKNRGRRVSFGAIRAIPQNFHENHRRESHLDMPKSGFKKPGVLLNSNHDSDPRSSTNPSSPSPSQSSVKDFVEQMCQQTIDEVLVMD
ncbi:hypothetical protein M3Y96_00367100 [Aphelenchoides besseyi]|nr:hypothetical protein M3Y96_00367100 [Aphelenchoides besseyi]